MILYLTNANNVSCIKQSVDVKCNVCCSSDDKGDIQNTIVMCDRCNKGFHLKCLVMEPPDIMSCDEWFCPRCRKSV